MRLIYAGSQPPSIWPANAHGRESIRRRCIRLTVALLGLLLLTVGSARAASSTLLDRLLAIEAEHKALCTAILEGDETRARIRELSTALGGRLRDAPGTQAASSDTPDARARNIVQAVNELIFRDVGIRPSHDLHDPCNLFLSSVLARKEGDCVSMAAVYLALAEQLDLPIHAVATSSHVFLRYDDGVTRVNIETFQNGAAVPDQHYIAQQKIAPRSVRKGVFLHALTADEFLAQARNNLGVIYSQRGDFERAAAEYDKALRLAPRFPAAWYNWGKDLQRQGDNEGALRCYSKSLRLHPNDAWALNNRGLAYRALGKEKKARRDFEQAIRIDPGFEQPRNNLDGDFSLQ